MLEQLLADIKIYLHISWFDVNTDIKLSGMINRGMARLQTIAGASLDFSVENTHRALLFDYVRYANSQALEMWEKNFASELRSLHDETQVNAEISLEIEAELAVTNAEISLLQADYDTAIALVNKLTDETIKNLLLERLATVKEAIDAAVIA